MGREGHDKDPICALVVKRIKTRKEPPLSIFMLVRKGKKSVG